jgi:hypothetical protein
MAGAALTFLARVVRGPEALATPAEPRQALAAAEWARLAARAAGDPLPTPPRSMASERVALADLEWETLESPSGIVSILDPSEPDEPTAMRALMAELENASEAPLPMGIVAELVVSTPDVPGTRRHRLTTTCTVVGRGDDVQLRVADKKISRRHASIEFKAGEFRIRDEKSANGTLLNGSRVLEYALRHGDEVVVGDTKLRFRCLRSA